MKPVPFKLDSESKTKLYFQLYQSFVEAFKSGQYKPEEKIPSVRQLSKDLSISKNTVIAAYNMLLEEGYIIAHSKSGYTVAGSLPKSVPETTIDSEEDQIPTVDSIFKEREGTEVTKIPVPEDLEIPKGTDNPPEEQKTEPQSVTKEPDSSNENQQSKTVTIPENPVKKQVPHDLFGERQLRKTIALFLYNNFKISCTSGQIYVASNVQDPLKKIINFIAPAKIEKVEKPNVQKVRGLFRKAEVLLAKEESITVKPAVSLSVNTLNSFYETLISEGYKIIEISKINDSINLEQLINASSDIAILSPEVDNLTDRDELLVWVSEKEERHIIEYYQNFPEDVPLCCENPNKIIFIGSIAGIAFMILPSPLISKFRETYSDYENSASKELQKQAETKIASLNEQIES